MGQYQLLELGRKTNGGGIVYSVRHALLCDARLKSHNTPCGTAGCGRLSVEQVKYRWVRFPYGALVVMSGSIPKPLVRGHNDAWCNVVEVSA